MEFLCDLNGISLWPIEPKTIDFTGFFDTRNQESNQESNQVSNQAINQGRGFRSMPFEKGSRSGFPKLYFPRREGKPKQQVV